MRNARLLLGYCPLVLAIGFVSLSLHEQMPSECVVCATCTPSVQPYPTGTRVPFVRPSATWEPTPTAKPTPKCNPLVGARFLGNESPETWDAVADAGIRLASIRVFGDAPLEWARAEVAAATSRGMLPMLVVWRTDEGGCTGDISTLGEWTRELVRELPDVWAWQWGNESDRLCPYSPAGYAQRLVVFHEAVVAAGRPSKTHAVLARTLWPEADTVMAEGPANRLYEGYPLSVMAGMTYETGAQFSWLAWMLTHLNAYDPDAGDFAAVHYYRMPGSLWPNAGTKVRSFRRQIQRQYPREVWLTELGDNTSDQSLVITSALDSAWAEGVKVLSIYRAQDDEDQQGFGIVGRSLPVVADWIATHD